MLGAMAPVCAIVLSPDRRARGSLYLLHARDDRSPLRPDGWSK
jgi:hypothetical protein